jgi:hypothetical protein
MNDKFGQFEWHCWKDRKPDKDKYLYIHIYDEDFKDSVDIGQLTDYDWDDNFYWCYVYMPESPKIEKKKLEPCNQLRDCSNNYILSLENRIEKIESLLNKVL